MKRGIRYLVTRMLWLPLLIFGTVGAVTLDVRERSAPLPLRTITPESLTGSVLVDVIRMPGSEQRIVTILVDSESAPGSTDGIADRLYQFQTVLTDGIEPGYYQEATVRYDRFSLTVTSGTMTLHFSTDPIRSSLHHSSVIEGFGLSKAVISGDLWRVSPSGLTADQKTRLLEECPDRPDRVPQDCASYGQPGGSCGLPSGSCEGANPSGCTLECPNGNCCAWCTEDSACCRCILAA